MRIHTQVATSKLATDSDFIRSVGLNEWRQIIKRRHCAVLHQRGPIIKQCSNPTVLRADLGRR